MPSTGDRRPAGLAVVFVLASMLAACSADPAGSGDSTPGQSPSANVQSGSPSTSPSAVDPCLQFERRAVLRMANRLWLAEDALLGSAHGTSTRAADLLKARTARVTGEVVPPCYGLPEAMERYVDAVRQHTQGPLDIEGMRAVYQAAIRWASAVGRNPRDLRRGLRDFNLCHELGSSVHASLRIWWRWTEPGKAWWIVMTYDNRSDVTLWGSLGGTAYARHLLGGETERPGSSTLLSWGGSSADIARIRPGVSQQLIGLGEMHTSATGTLVVREATVGVQVPRRLTHRYAIGCAIPVALQ